MLTDQVARSLDAPNTRVLDVPHPLGGTDEATIRAWADDAVAKTVELLTGSPPAAAPEPVVAAPASAQQIATAIAEVQALVAADGGELVLESFDATSAEFRLVLDTAECRECVLPAEHLEAIVLDKLKQHAPALDIVRIQDPRT